MFFGPDYCSDEDDYEEEDDEFVGYENEQEEEGEGVDGEEEFENVFEFKAGEIIKIITPGAKCLQQEPKTFTATSFAMRGPRHKHVSDDSEEEEDYATDEKEGESEEEDNNSAEVTEEEVNGVIKKAEGIEYWDIPIARKFLGDLKEKLVTKTIHYILPCIFKHWPINQSAKFIWELAEEDVLAFASLIDSRDPMSFENNEQFVSVFTPKDDMKLVSQAINTISKLEQLTPKDLGKLIKDCAVVWHLLPEEGVLGTIVCGLLESISVPKSVIVIKEIISEHSTIIPDWKEEFGGFFREITEKWSREKKVTLIDFITQKWKWNSQIINILTKELNLNNPASQQQQTTTSTSTTIEQMSDEQKVSEKQKRQEKPQVPEPKPKRRESNEAAEPMQEENKQSKKGKKGKKKNKPQQKKQQNKQQQQQQKPKEPEPMEEAEEEVEDDDEGKRDEEFSIDDLSDLLQRMGKAPRPTANKSGKKQKRNR